MERVTTLDLASDLERRVVRLLEETQDLSIDNARLDSELATAKSANATLKTANEIYSQREQTLRAQLADAKVELEALQKTDRELNDKLHEIIFRLDESEADR